MSNPTAPVLDDSNSKYYRPRSGSAKHALIEWQPARYELSWGVQTFDGPHVVIDSENGKYGCELVTFFQTYTPINEQEHYYRKTVPVRVLQVQQDTAITTVLNGRVEAVSTVRAGGYIIQNPGGEQYYNTAEEFLKNYEPV